MKPKLILGCALVLSVISALVVIATTKTTKTLGMSFYENTTFKFMVSVVPNDAVDFTGQRFWIASWPGGVKCVAGVNVPLPGRQFTIQILRWSWKG